MRKKGENSFKCAGKSAIPPDKNNDFTLGVESQSVPLLISLPSGWALPTFEEKTDHRRVLRHSLGGERLGSVRVWLNLLRSIGGRDAARSAVGQC
jgi:hypothetical protein